MGMGADAPSGVSYDATGRARCGADSPPLTRDQRRAIASTTTSTRTTSDNTRGLLIVTPAKAIRQCHEAHLRRDLLHQALEQARQRGLLNRSAYAELMHELDFDSATVPTR